MNPYAGQGLEREPFSNSPDPHFMCGTRQHATCLQELELSLRLRRGLNVVTGDIGTGKTTLCRSLLRAFAEDRDTDVHLLLDPHFESTEEFLRVILISVSGLSPEPGMGVWALKEALKQQLFRLGLVEKRLVILVIDEGQKISRENLEILREMLNYETNTSKLLQIVLFGQRELEPMLDAMPNLVDRINVRRGLTPMSFSETRQMIRYRLSVAAGGGRPRVSFTWPALLAIHMASGGSPRKTVRICHMALLEMIVRGKRRVGLSEVRAVTRPEQGGHGAAPRRPRRAVGLAGLAALAFAGGALWYGVELGGPVLDSTRQQALPSQGIVAPAQPQQPAPVLPASAQPGQESTMSSEGLTLRAEDCQPAAEGQGRLSLLPQHDQGPAVRNPVDGEARERLHVEKAGHIQTASLDSRDQLARKALYPAGRP